MYSTRYHTNLLVSLHTFAIVLTSLLAPAGLTYNPTQNPEVRQVLAPLALLLALSPSRMTSHTEIHGLKRRAFFFALELQEKILVSFASPCPVTLTVTRFIDRITT